METPPDGLVERLEALRPYGLDPRTFNLTQDAAAMLRSQAARIRELEGELAVAGQYTEAHQRLDELARERVAAAEAALTEALKERDEAREEKAAAREAFLDMIADARRWDEDVDGDFDGVTVTFFGEFGDYSVRELIAALGIPFDRHRNSTADAIQSALESSK